MKVQKQKFFRKCMLYAQLQRKAFNGNMILITLKTIMSQFKATIVKQTMKSKRIYEI